MLVEDAAKICHEANKALCETQGDFTQISWELAPDWQKESAIQGVRFKLDNPEATPEQQHQAWTDSKVNDGWVWGPSKNADLKTHHCLVPYNELPVQQQAKDHLFTGIVKSLAQFIKI